MRGLLKNNLFTTLSSAKIFFAAIAVLGVFVTAVISQPLLIGYVLLSMVGFSVVSITGLHKENISKWGKYKLTAPIKRIDIVKSYFISQLIWLIVGVVIALIVMGLSSFTNWLLGPNMTTVQLLIGIAIIMASAVTCFVVSFPITTMIFKKKEY